MNGTGTCCLVSRNIVLIENLCVDLIMITYVLIFFFTYSLSLVRISIILLISCLIQWFPFQQHHIINFKENKPVLLSLFISSFWPFSFLVTWEFSSVLTDSLFPCLVTCDYVCQQIRFCSELFHDISAHIILDTFLFLPLHSLLTVNSATGDSELTLSHLLLEVTKSPCLCSPLL